jgi:capsular polysaccharide biosynthesis protein
MELKEYLNIIRKNLQLFISVAVVIVLAVFSFFYLRPVFYNASLTLNISRSGAQATDQFKYDDFYRLQADEKFAETIVEWLKDPRIVSDIYTEAGINTQNFSLKQLQKSLAPEKLSSQVITINFSAPDKKIAQKVSQAVTSVISQTTQSLNKNQKEDTWFEIVPQDPVIVRYQPDFLLIFIASIVAGIFLAFWVVMTKHYLY